MLIISADTHYYIFMVVRSSESDVIKMYALHELEVKDRLVNMGRA